MPLAPLERHLPKEGEVSVDTLLEGFLAYAEDKGLSLYPAQEEAVLELFDDRSVVLNTPTGSGKSLVALAAHFKAVAEGGRSFYTAPIKALVSEKFFELCEVLGPDNVGMMTGDASINRDAPVICCTAEILSNLALREGSDADVDMVVIDEFHFYADRDRGVAWQVPLLTLPQARFVLMSATMGDTTRFERALEQLSGDAPALVKTTDRPVPLDWEYRETPLHETLGDLLEEGKTPIYVVHFSQREAAERAQDLMSIDFLSKDEKAKIKAELKGARWDTPFGKELRRFVHHGVGVHHAGMLPKYRRLVERLARQGLLRIICGTDTLGVGVNIPLRTVVFTKLCKYDGDKTKVLTVRDFHQIAGRAGRKGFDTQGSVVAQAPQHAIENLSLKRKADGDPKRLRKLKLKKPPERGYAHWDEQTFDRLRSAEPEKLASRFRVSHGMLLNVLARPNGCAAMKDLIRSSHEPRRRKRQHARRAIAMIRSLMAADIVDTEKAEDGGVRINESLQNDFSLNQALSLWVVEVADAEVFDREPEDQYALDMLTVVEATLETPAVVIRRQVDTLKGRAVARMKAAGMDYDQRMEELEKVEAPQPNAELLWGTFTAFAERHPYVGGDSLRPKSIARDMIEQGETFNGYVKTYGLARSEGVLLRYLSDAYKALTQTIPEDAKSDALYDLTDWLGAVVRSVDASLIDEWERLRRGEEEGSQALLSQDDEPDAGDDAAADVTRNTRNFTKLVRNACFRLVQQLAAGQSDLVAERVESPAGRPRWNGKRIDKAMAGYWEQYEFIRIDADARGPALFELTMGEDRWQVTQILLDPEEHLSYRLELMVDLAASRAEGGPVMTLLKLGEAGGVESPDSDSDDSDDSDDSTTPTE